MPAQTINQPFSSTSIWNTPIGQGASYQSSSGKETATIQNPKGVVPWIHGEAMTVYQAKSTDPLMMWNYDSRADTPEWAHGGQPWGGSFQMRTPESVKFAAVDGWAIIVSEDGKHFYETWLGSYNASSKSYHTNFIAENNLTGTGIAPAPGEHDGVRAAGLSLFGGLVRDHELDNLNIPHAIAMAISTTQAKAGQEASSQYTWPASSADAFSVGGYTGSIPMGALFAIPKSVDITKIGITTPEGLALAKAYQNYGGYVVDTAGDRTNNIAYVEDGASEAQVEHLRADVGTIENYLTMVTNNSKADPGGPGAPVGGGTSAPIVPTVPVEKPPVDALPVPKPPVQPPADGGAAPTKGTIGSGSDTLVLKISQDAYKGDAQYTVSIDGKQIGGTLTAHASHAGPQTDTLTVKGNWGVGNHDVAVNFINNLWEGTATTNRNLYVEGATYNGKAVAKSWLTLRDNGPEHITVQDATAVKASTATTPTTGAARSDTLVLKVSQDAYKGDAQYTISVDGKQIGGTRTADASHAAGQSDTITVTGNWGSGDHKLSINYLNDKWGGTPATDRNLYIDGAIYNGKAVAGSKLTFAEAGPDQIVFHDSGPAAKVAVSASAKAISASATSVQDAPVGVKAMALAAPADTDGVGDASFHAPFGEQIDGSHGTGHLAVHHYVM